MYAANIPPRCFLISTTYYYWRIRRPALFERDWAAPLSSQRTCMSAVMCCTYIIGLERQATALPGMWHPANTRADKDLNIRFNYYYHNNTSSPLWKQFVQEMPTKSSSNWAIMGKKESERERQREREKEREREREMEREIEIKREREAERERQREREREREGEREREREIVIGD